MAKLKLGLIGTGVAARKLYLPAFQRLGNKLDIVACANRTRRKAVHYARLASIPRVVDTAEELMNLPEVEAVLISVPIDAQPALVERALSLGKAVISEKPMAPSVAEGKKLLAAVAKREAPWLVGENFAFMPALAKVRAWLDAGKLGQPRLLESYQLTCMNAKNPYFHTAWRHAPKHVGGFVADGGVHMAHAVRRVLGMPDKLENITAQFDPVLTPIDTAIAVLRFGSGALGTWTSCFSAHYQGPMLRLYGSKATAELYWNHAVLRNPKGRETVFRTNVDSFTAQFSHFCDVVKKGAPLAYTPEEALQDLTLIQAIVT
jgi:predicted dehydrogenase